MVSDEVLIARVIKYDRTAGEILFSRYSDLIYFYILKNVKDENNAKDILQTTFLKAFKYLKKIKDRKKFKSWLYSIARNSIFDFYIKNKNDVDFDNLSEIISSPQKDDPVVYKELKVEIENAIKKLSKKQNRVVKLRVFSELKFTEISKEMNITENNAKVTYHKALKKLKVILEAVWKS